MCGWGEVKKDRLFRCVKRKRKGRKEVIHRAGWRPRRRRGGRCVCGGEGGGMGGDGGRREEEGEEGRQTQVGKEEGEGNERRTVKGMEGGW